MREKEGGGRKAEDRGGSESEKKVGEEGRWTERSEKK